MAGIYLHIPFCRQACHYCDFHFSTNLEIQPTLIQAMVEEISLRKDYLSGEAVETLYFGGGTPSLLSTTEIEALMEMLRTTHTVSDDAEITLEVNPDDVTLSRLEAWRSQGINRLSIGIQSFDDPILKYLNRIHSAQDATECVRLVREAGFDNFSIDLIYAIPGLSSEAWQRNINLALEIAPPHISAYTLTIEQKTVFGNWLAKGKLKAVDEASAAEQLEMLMESLSLAGYKQYEISNFARPGYESKHNSSYWKGLKYLGVGPGAHSYNTVSRQFNIANNHLYVRALNDKQIPAETEILKKSDHINEYILTSLRTDQGCDLSRLKVKLGHDLLAAHPEYLSELQRHKLATVNDHRLRLTQAGKLLADKIASDLFSLEDETTT